jgi:hypothetical protein
MTDELINNIIAWAEARNLVHPENASKQACKIMEEVGEMAGAFLKGDRGGLIDGVGDALVTIIIFAAQNGLSPQVCLQMAWEEIKDRKGKTVDGTFLKDI